MGRLRGKPWGALLPFRRLPYVATAQQRAETTRTTIEGAQPHRHDRGCVRRGIAEVSLRMPPGNAPRACPPGMPPGNAPRECPPGMPLGRRRAPVNSEGVTPPMTFKRALLAGGVIASGVMATGAWCGAAYAQPFQGLYVNVDGGFNWRDGVGVSSVLPTLPGPWVGGSRIQGAPGWVALGSAGYGFGNGLRLELEGNYRQSDFNKLTGTPAPTSTGGQFRTYGVMANAMFDLDIGWPWLFP